jgi:hypothetical protein
MTVAAAHPQLQLFADVVAPAAIVATAVQQVLTLSDSHSSQAGGLAAGGVGGHGDCERRCNTASRWPPPFC